MSIPENRIRATGKSVFASPDLPRESAESRRECVRRDLTRRLQRVCENLSVDDFNDLVGRMTREQLRGEKRRPPFIV